MNCNVYNFDKTIYKKNSSIHFYIYCLKKNKKLIKYLPKQLKEIILYIWGKSTLLKTQEVFFSFLGSIDNIDVYIKDFWEKENKNIQKWYLKKKKKNDVIISESPEFLLSPITKKLNIKYLIATKMNSKNGTIISKDYYKKEKLFYLKEQIPNIEIDSFYSNSTSDISFAKNAKKAFIVSKAKIVTWNKYREPKIKKICNLLLSKEFFLFLIIGVINTINNIIFSYIYSIALNVNLSFILGYLSSLTISYLLNSFVTFKENLKFSKYIKFGISYIPNFIIQNVIVIIFYNYLHLYKLFVYTIAAIIGVPVTFIFMKIFAFKKKNLIQ